MKKILTSLIFSLAATSAAFADRGIVVAHYGSSNDETRALTIDRITAEIAVEAGPDIPVVTAYISPAVRRAMNRKGHEALSPVDAMLRLRAAGVDSVIVQPSLIIDGGEMELLTADVESLRPFFSDIQLGRPLCYSPADFGQVADILSQEDTSGADAVIFVGHGNELPSTATYTQLDYMLADRCMAGRHVSTIEGYPTAATTARQLKREGLKTGKVRLVPFLLVCGNHTREDIAVDFAGKLREEGFEPEVVMRGLAELPSIRAIYTERVKRMLGR